MNPIPPALRGVARLYGPEGLDRLRSARVLIVGLGGVGSWTVEALARSGLGALDLVDLDEVCTTNINRQIHALHSTVGQAKAELLAERCRLINPDLAVTSHFMYYTATTCDRLLLPNLSLVIDAIDSIPHKCHLLATCRERGIPVVTTGGGGGKMRPELIMVEDLSRTRNDPLLARTRKILRQKFAFPRSLKTRFGIPTVYSPELPQPPRPDPETGAAPAGRLDCAGGLGSEVAVTATLGLLAASVAQRLLLNNGASKDSQ